MLFLDQMELIDMMGWRWKFRPGLRNDRHIGTRGAQVALIPSDHAFCLR